MPGTTWETDVKKLTITVDDEVYEGLQRVVGRRKIARFLQDLARPHVVRNNLEAGYRAMAEDRNRESEALVWAEGLLGEGNDEKR
ncbi:MAG: addiction module antitoxin [Planctomycetes bacterium]|nr:addiction module antitoxin [Planctomycetota bacterium]